MSISSSSSSVFTTTKWLGFVTGVCIESISGSAYTFSNYSNALKFIMHLTQTELNNLSVAKDVGKAFGLLAGIASDKIPIWAILLIGSIEGLIGYGVQWLVVGHIIPPLPYWQICVVLCMGANSTTWMNTAVLVTCMRNFRRNRGHVSGILKGYLGLSAAIFIGLCSALFSNDAAVFLLMLALIPFAVGLAGMFFLREVPIANSTTTAEDSEEEKYFCICYVVAVVLAVYLLTYGFVPNPSTLFSRAFVVIMIVLLVSPFGIPVYSYFKGRKTYQVGPTIDVNGHEVRESLLQIGENRESETALAVLEEEPEVLVVKGPPTMGEEHTILEVFRSVDFWILFLSYLCGVGTGLAVINNMGQIGLALGYIDVSIFVSLNSIWSFFGRIISGFVSELFIKKAATPRPLWNALSQVVMFVGYILMAKAMPGSVYIGSIVVGICYGVRIGVTTPTASELFGLKYYGIIYNILIINLPLGSFLFSGLLAGMLYDMEATTTEGGGNTCVGGHCYRLVFIVMAGACVVGFFLDILLSIRTKNVYNKIYMSKNSKKSSGNYAVD